MKIATGEGRLQNVAGIHRALRRTRTDDGVELIDEQDDATVRLSDLLEHALETVLELATILGTSNQGTHIELNELLVLQRGRDVARDDTLREALDDGGLAHAGLADEHGVVLGAAREHLDGAANLLDTADDRVELALTGEVRHVAAIALERLELRLGILAGHTLVTAKVIVGLLDALAREARVLEDAAGIRAIVCKSAEEVLARDIGVTHLGGELLRGVNNLDEFVGETNLLARTGHLGLARDLIIDRLRDGVRICPDALDYGAQVTFPGVEQGFEQVDGLDGASLRIRGDADGGLKSLLGRDGHFI